VTDWTSLDLPAFDAAPAGAGWTPVLWAGERPLVAVRESPARQAWVGLDTDGWANRPEYVVFWTAVFDWVAQGGESYAAHSLAELTPDWQRDEEMTGTGHARAPQTTLPTDYDPAPGIYRRGDGAVRAFNAVVPRPSRAASKPSSKLSPPAGWRDRLRTTLAGYDTLPGRLRLVPWLLVGSLACFVMAAGLWRRESLTAVRGACTF
jgi:hypothetical protein